MTMSSSEICDCRHLPIEQKSFERFQFIFDFTNLHSIHFVRTLHHKKKHSADFSDNIAHLVLVV